MRDVADVAKAAFLCYALGVLGTLGYCVARLEKRGVVPRSRQTTAADVFSLFATLLYASEAGAGHFDVASTWGRLDRKARHASSAPREMIARPRMSQNESKTTEIRGL